MGILIKPQIDQAGGILRPVAITPETAGWQYVSFAVYHLTRGQTLRGAANGRETALIVLSGTGRAQLNGRGSASLKKNQRMLSTYLKTRATRWNAPRMAWRLLLPVLPPHTSIFRPV